MGTVDYTDIFNTSYEKMMNIGEEFFDDFYQRFMLKSEKIRDLFDRVDMERQKLMLRKSITFMILFASNKKGETYLADLADNHARLNISHDMFEHWMSALIESVAYFDPFFNKEVEVAWRVNFSPGIEYMRHHPEGFGSPHPG